MPSVIGEVTSQAIGIAISPVAVVLAILMLISARGKANAIAFTIGWMIGVAAITTAALLLAHGADASTDPDTQSGIHLIHLVLGLLFAYLAVRTWQKRPREGAPPEEPKLFTTIDSMTGIKAAGVGFAIASVIAPKNLALEVSGGTKIAQGGLAGSGDIVAIVIFTIIASLAVLIPVIAVLVLGDRSSKALATTKEWLMTNNTTIMLVLFVVLGSKFIGEGLGFFN